MIAANDALERLKQGNARFAANVRDMSALASKSRRHDLLDGQEPFAIVLGCSDSRVPAELVFDQGLGDLFVIRVAGNIVAPIAHEGLQVVGAEYSLESGVVDFFDADLDGVYQGSVEH